MAWFDECDKYFLADLDDARALFQGDIIIAPTAVIVPGVADTDIAAPSELDVVRRVTLWRASETVDLPGAPSLSADVRWGLAMVLPHSCALEKEWNERIQELIATGMGKSEAEGEATADPNLDSRIAIAPVLACDGLGAERVAAVSRGESLGFFPVPSDGRIPQSYVDFNQISTVRWEVLSRKQRLTALSDLSRAHLGHRLATFFAYREKSTLGEIEAAVGQRIVDVNATPTAKRLTVALILEDGSTLILEGERGQTRQAGADRPARG